MTKATGSLFVKVCAAILVVFFVAFGVILLAYREWEAGFGAFACTVLPSYYLITRRAKRG